MFLPRDEPKYERLNTSFTNFGELIAELAGQRHTGYVEVSFPDYVGIVLLDAGSVVNAVEQSGGRRGAGEAALRGIGQRARERNGQIAAYGLPASVVTTLGLVANSEIVYRDLSASFVNVDRLIAKLQSDHHTGYVEVSTPASQGLGYIFLRAGEVVEAVLAAEGPQLSGPAALQRLVQIAPEANALLNVYRAVGEATPVPAPARAAAPESAAEVPPECDAVASGGEQPVAPAETPRPIEAWQEIISRIEAVVDGCSSKGTFAAAFKRSLIACAGQYPFLDPFAAEFSYQVGAITFVGAPDHDFNNGLGFCLRETVRGLAGQLKQKNLVLLIRTTLAAPIARYIETIDELDLRATLPELLA